MSISSNDINKNENENKTNSMNQRKQENFGRALFRRKQYHGQELCESKLSRVLGLLDLVTIGIKRLLIDKSNI